MTNDSSELLNQTPEPGIGIGQLPQSLQQSQVLSATDLAKLATVAELPVIDPSFSDERLTSIFQYYSINPEEMETEVHLYAKELLTSNDVFSAWQVLLATA
jgi:5,10-methenyltetrahydromethanopterin hydrogenase